MNIQINEMMQVSDESSDAFLPINCFLREPDCQHDWQIAIQWLSDDRLAIGICKKCCFLSSGRVNKELTQDKPKPKYEVGQVVFFLDLPVNEIHEGKIINVLEDEYHVLPSDVLHFQEDQLYPTKQALIESQITYWCAQLDMKDEIQYWAKQHDESLSSCCSVHTGTTEECHDIQSNQDEVDLHGCQHERDKSITVSQAGLPPGMWVSVKHKCIKCGEFYKEECQHESNGLIYSVTVPSGVHFDMTQLTPFKCKRCGEFYR